MAVGGQALVVGGLAVVWWWWLWWSWRPILRFDTCQRRKWDVLSM